jgi:hypothetical protein
MAVGKAIHTFLNDDSYQPGDALTYRPPRGGQMKIEKWCVRAVRRDDQGREFAITRWGATWNEIEALRKGALVDLKERHTTPPFRHATVRVVEVDPVDLLRLSHRTICVE